MAIKVTPQAALQRMQNAITQANLAFEHNIESDIKDAWQHTMADMIRIRKLGIKINETYKEMRGDR